MSLKKLFNSKYFFQNIKKSAPTLAIFCGMVPVLNTIIFLLSISSNQYGYLATLDNISTFTCVGMYVLPFILAVCLYDFIFKKKSVDFIGSMPITKKSIFVTNTIGGSIIIFVMIFFTTLLMYITSLFFSNVYLPIGMLVDYFIIFLVGYLFIYITSSLAFSISGNMITGLAVTLLLLFFIPFVRSYTTIFLYPTTTNSYVACSSSECKPDYYYCDEAQNSCSIHQANGEYEFVLDRKIDEQVYTLPYYILADLMEINNSDEGVIHFNKKVIFLTILVTIVYTLLGYYCFGKRKLEVSETSFADFNIHLFVKFLTLFPFGILAYHLLSLDAFFLGFFIFVLLLIYYFVYDLITRKKIENLKKSLISFLLSIFVIFIFCYIVDRLNPDEKEYVIKEEEITKITFNSTLEFTTGSIKDEKQIANVLSLLTKRDANEEISDYFSMTLHVGKEEYIVDLALSREDYEALKKIIFEENMENDSSLDQVYAIKLYEHFIKGEEKKKILDEISSALSVFDGSDDTCSLSSNIVLYSYKNHQMYQDSISPCISKTLEQKIIEHSNRYILKQLEENQPDIFLLEEKEEIDSFLYRYYSDFRAYILKHISDEVDLEKELFQLRVVFYNPYEEVIFYTNAIDEANELLETLREKFKDTEEYEIYLKEVSGEEYE